MSDIKLWENPLFSIEERWVHANAEIFARGQTIATLKEQNALLTVQVQKVYAALELLHDHARLYLGAYHEGQNVFDSSMDALTTLAALPQQVKSEDARDAEPPIIYYMRDNHTFMRLSLDVDAAIEQIRAEFAEDWTHGMLCSKSAGMPADIHAHGRLNQAAFENEVREWYAALSAQD